MRLMEIMVRLHFSSTSTFTSAFASNFNQCGDIDTENGYRTHSLHLGYVTIPSNADVDIDAKC